MPITISEKFDSRTLTLKEVELKGSLELAYTIRGTDSDGGASGRRPGRLRRPGA